MISYIENGCLMGCLVFIAALVLSWMFYAIVGSLVADYILQLKGITGVEAHGAGMTYFFETVPLLTFVTTIIIMIIWGFTNQPEGADQQPTSKEHEDEWWDGEKEDEADFK